MPSTFCAPRSATSAPTAPIPLRCRGGLKHFTHRKLLCDSAVRQAGTLVGEHRTVWTDVDGTLFSSASETDPCPQGSKLLETSSAICIPDGVYTASCDICCDPKTNEICSRSETAEQFAGQQAAAALGLTSSATYTLLASAVLSSYVFYIGRANASEQDKPELCAGYTTAQKVLDKTRAAAGTLKAFTVKVTNGNPPPELAFRSALISQQQSVKMAFQACQDPSFGAK